MFVDTCFCIDLIREQHRKHQGPATQKLVKLGNAPLFASVFVICELQAGAHLSSGPRRQVRKVELLTNHFTVIYPDQTFAVAYGETEAYLRKKGVPIPTMDLLVGATAKVHGLPLLTRDVAHFESIPGLVIERY